MSFAVSSNAPSGVIVARSFTGWAIFGIIASVITGVALIGLVTFKIYQWRKRRIYGVAIGGESSNLYSRNDSLIPYNPNENEP